MKSEPDLFLVTSERDASLFSELYNISENKFFIGSYPRINNFICNAKNEKIILYAPTFRYGKGQEYYNINIFPDTNSLLELNSLLVEFDYRFVIKLHSYTNADFPEVHSFSNIDLVSSYMDIQELLYDTDILVTDYSSVYFDYLILNKEVVFIALILTGIIKIIIVDFYMTTEMSLQELR